MVIHLLLEWHIKRKRAAMTPPCPTHSHAATTPPPTRRSMHNWRHLRTLHTQTTTRTSNCNFWNVAWVRCIVHCDMGACHCTNGVSHMGALCCSFNLPQSIGLEITSCCIVFAWSVHPPPSHLQCETLMTDGWASVPDGCVDFKFCVNYILAVCNPNMAPANIGIVGTVGMSVIL